MALPNSTAEHTGNAEVRMLKYEVFYSAFGIQHSAWLMALCVLRGFMFGETLKILQTLSIHTCHLALR